MCRRLDQRGGSLPLSIQTTPLGLELDSDLHPGSPAAKGHIQRAPRWQDSQRPCSLALGWHCSPQPGPRGLWAFPGFPGPGCWEETPPQDGLSTEGDMGMSPGILGPGGENTLLLNERMPSLCTKGLAKPPRTLDSPLWINQLPFLASQDSPLPTQGLEWALPLFFTWGGGGGVL